MSSSLFFSFLSSTTNRTAICPVLNCLKKKKRSNSQRRKLPDRHNVTSPPNKLRIFLNHSKLNSSNFLFSSCKKSVSSLYMSWRVRLSAAHLPCGRSAIDPHKSLLLIHTRKSHFSRTHTRYNTYRGYLERLWRSNIFFIASSVYVETKIGNPGWVGIFFFLSFLFLHSSLSNFSSLSLFFCILFAIPIIIIIMWRNADARLVPSGFAPFFNFFFRHIPFRFVFWGEGGDLWWSAACVSHQNLIMCFFLLIFLFSSSTFGWSDQECGRW